MSAEKLIMSGEAKKDLAYTDILGGLSLLSGYLLVSIAPLVQTPRKGSAMQISYLLLAYTKPFIPLHSVAFHKVYMATIPI